MTVHMLNIHSEEELIDIATWLDEHPDDEAMADAGINPDVKPRLEALLVKTLTDNLPSSYPLQIQIPDDLAQMLEATMTDWEEVLDAHRETLITDLVEVDA